MTSRICYRCQAPTPRPTPVVMEHGGSVGGATIYACPKHARDYPQDAVTQAAAERRARQHGRTA